MADRRAVLYWWVTACIATACSSPVPESKSTGTNWLECHDDADCAQENHAHCGADHFCVDANGTPIEAKSASTLPVTPADAGMTTPFTSADAGMKDASSTAQNEQNDPMRGRMTALVLPLTSTCYSPGQNLEHAYDAGAVGCRCGDANASLCVNSGGRPGTHAVALECLDGQWKAVNDGACDGCWTPEQPEMAFAEPSNGCACDVGSPQSCVHTTAYGSWLAECIDGRWQLTDPEDSCRCTSDAQCGYGGMCQQRTCILPRCEVDGVQYLTGAKNVPDPFSCNTCTCEQNATLGECTTRTCPVYCPPNELPGGAIIACQPDLGGATTWRTGCVSQCHSDADCGDLVCDNEACVALCATNR